MQIVRCYECGKHYDYDEDGFCPNCGAFNQRPRSGGKEVGGSLRVDGINERNHAESFVHRELHGETHERRKYGLDKSVEHLQKVASPVFQAGGGNRNKTGKSNPVQTVVWVIFLIVMFNILASIFAILS